MAQQEGGWPLGLQPLINVRVGLIRRSLDVSSSLSFTASPTSTTTTTSEFDTESSITLGNLIGITRIVELSNGRKCSTMRERKSCCKAKDCFSLCPRAQFNSDEGCRAPSLGHFLQVERRAHNARINSLFSNGLIAPTTNDRSSCIKKGMGHGVGFCFGLIFPCMR
ncbi:uncharacterized protein A4U43_C05F3510 [Asparagus officinalis]|uniref:Uncharacterized protein n=1 Tax=Asparagus officinalis TaxID=4686 RepID=A0A5P1EP25_ASPOF|nr:uncharacterized protein LOC109840238 [Asparagus officinalis]ONK67762.1 uncharacterized protein A4U43_C05F3510 [Asparagus officinalis]